MFTMKHESPEGYQIQAVGSHLCIARPSDTQWQEIAADFATQKKKPIAAIQYGGPDVGASTRYVYEGERVWIMNENGRTVASV